MKLRKLLKLRVWTPICLIIVLLLVAVFSVPVQSAILVTPMVAAGQPHTVYDEGYEAGYQAGLDASAETIADLEEQLAWANDILTLREQQLDDAEWVIFYLRADLVVANGHIANLEQLMATMYTQEQLDAAVAAAVADLTISLEQGLLGLEEIKNLLATPPGQRSSTSSYEGVLGDELNEIIEMLLAPQGSNISETTPHGKKK